MSTTKDKIKNAYKWAITNCPKVNGYPYLAESLRQAGVTRYVSHLPSCQRIYFTHEGNVVDLMDALVTGMNDVPRFNKEAFMKVLKSTQLGESTFPEFLRGSWEAGVIYYEADLIARNVQYHGANGELYVEDYPAVEINK